MSLDKSRGTADQHAQINQPVLYVTHWFEPRPAQYRSIIKTVIGKLGNIADISEYRFIPSFASYTSSQKGGCCDTIKTHPVLTLSSSFVNTYIRVNQQIAWQWKGHHHFLVKQVFEAEGKRSKWKDNAWLTDPNSGKKCLTKKFSFWLLKICVSKRVIAAVAQRIARWTSNSEVVGSSPIGGVYVPR